MRTMLAAALIALPAAGLAQEAPERAPDVDPYGDYGDYSYYTPDEVPTAEPTVYFQNVMDGATVTTPVFLEFGMVGITVRPAGEQLEDYTVGHHHLLINRDAGSVTAGEPMPNEDDLIHFGAGETSATLELPPGTHTLQLVAGDTNHVPFDPMVASDQITVTVVE